MGSIKTAVQVKLSLADESKLSYHGWRVVAMIALANLTGFGLINAFSVFFKPLASDFGWSRAATAGAYSLYAITHNVFAPFIGAITDKFGPRIAAASGGFCLGGSMILMSQISSIWEMYLYYVFILGFGIAAIYAPMMATVSQYFSSRRGLAMGIAATGVGGGSLLLSPLAGWLVTSFGWRVAYFVIGVIAWIIFIPVTIFVKGVPREKLNTKIGWRSSENFSFLQAFKTKSLWLYNFCFFFIAISVWPILIHIVPFFTDKGVVLVNASALAGLIGGSSVIGRIGGGFLSDRTGRKHILVAGYALQMVSLIWLFYSQEMWMFLIFAVLFGISSGSWAGIIAAFPADYFGLKATGSILGVALIMVGIGSGVGTYFSGYFFDRTQSHDSMIAMCIVSALIATLLAFFLNPPKKRLESI